MSSRFSKKRIVILLLFISLIAGLSFLLFNPKTGIFKKHIREGIISYKASVVDGKDFSSMTMPDKMTVTFKNDYSAAELEAGLGFVRMKFISDPVKKIFLSQVYFLEKKQSVMDMDEIAKTNYYFPDYTVEYGNKTKEIAGCKCVNAVLKFVDGSPSTEVWLTHDISIKNPNWSNAYYKIDGVLMDYTLKKYGLKLHFTASSVTESKIDDNFFTVAPEYTKVKNKEIEKMFSGFFD
ncbi:MAG: hypothetical protein HY064_15460 [Bacteroidetes bacterium]|nr:hypothetical protein [Bacteroidota bacterium]